MATFAWIAAWVLAGPLACAFLYWRKSRIREMGEQCAVCGYLVRGLPSSICPECGSDLLKVGYRRPGFWSRLRPGRRRTVVTLGWFVWAALGLMLWNVYQERLAPGERRRSEGFRAEIGAPDKVMTMWRSARFRYLGWKNAGERTSAKRLDGISLTIHPRIITTGGNCEPDEMHFVSWNKWPEMRYAIVSKQLRLMDGSTVRTSTATDPSDACRKFCAFAVEVDPSLDAAKIESAARELVSISEFSPLTKDNGRGITAWAPDSYGAVLFGAGLLALTVPVLIVARRVA